MCAIALPFLSWSRPQCQRWEDLWRVGVAVSICSLRVLYRDRSSTPEPPVSAHSIPKCAACCALHAPVAVSPRHSALVGKWATHMSLCRKHQEASPRSSATTCCSSSATERLLRGTRRALPRWHTERRDRTCEGARLRAFVCSLPFGARDALCVEALSLAQNAYTVLVGVFTSQRTKASMCTAQGDGRQRRLGIERSDRQEQEQNRCKGKEKLSVKTRRDKEELSGHNGKCKRQKPVMPSSTKKTRKVPNTLHIETHASFHMSGAEWRHHLRALEDLADLCYHSTRSWVTGLKTAKVSHE